MEFLVVGDRWDLLRSARRSVYFGFTEFAHHTGMTVWKSRLAASGLHLGISAVVAALAAAIVFGVWYPYPYRDISGGRELFLILVGVDVVIGPLITLAVFDRAKPARELRTDLGVVAALQVAALSYGIWTMAVARPVHLVFEIDRFRVVHAVDVPEELMPQVPAGVDAMPWFGPTPLAVRAFRDANESASATMAALQGIAIGARPDFWVPYERARPEVLRAARPVAQLKARLPEQAARIDAVLRDAGRDAQQAVFVPMTGRKAFWTAFLDPATAQVVAFLPLDSF